MNDTMKTEMLSDELHRTKMCFAPIRKKALKQWLKGTGRKRKANDFSDDYSDALECTWQSKYTSANNFDNVVDLSGQPISQEQKDDLATWDKKHSALYCSLGEWNSHLTDLLTDKRYDKLILHNDANKNLNEEDIEDHQLALFRYYSRILLITSEILTDFTEVTKILYITTDKKARAILSNGCKANITVDGLFKYINDKCKHKAEDGKLFCYNHHLPIFFKDCMISEPDGKHITMYKLGDIIEVILNCYRVIDNKLELEYDQLKHLLEKFEAKY